MIRDDILLAELFFDLLGDVPEIERLDQALTSARFRFVPQDLIDSKDTAVVARYLDQLNRELSERVGTSGLRLMTDSLTEGRIFLRASLVDIGETTQLVQAVPRHLAVTGRRLDNAYRCQTEASEGSDISSSSSSSVLALTKSGESKPSSKCPYRDSRSSRPS